MIKILFFLLLIFCYQIIYADIKNKSIIIISVKTNNDFAVKNIKRRIIKIQKQDIDLIPSYYIFNKKLKMKMLTGYSLIDPNKSLTVEDYITPLKNGIILLKIRLVLL